MEYPIYYHGRPVGELQAVSDGLYWQLTAWCERFADGVQRLYGGRQGSAEPFGVFGPGGKGLHLHRRLSKQSCPVLPEHWVAGREEDGWRPWCGVVEGQTICDAMLCPDQDGLALALFFGPEGELPLAEYVSAMEEGMLEGRPCLMLRLDRDGAPILPAGAEQPEETAPELLSGENALAP